MSGGRLYRAATWRTVHALREAGAIILGKTTTTEFAATTHGTHQ